MKFTLKNFGVSLLALGAVLFGSSQSQADILVVPLKIQLTGAVPSKLYEAMAMEKPVILVAGSEAASIVEQARCGIVVRPGDVEGLAAAILYLKRHPDEARQMGINGRQAAVQSHDRQQIAENFAQFLTRGLVKSI